MTQDRVKDRIVQLCKAFAPLQDPLSKDAASVSSIDHVTFSLLASRPLAPLPRLPYLQPSIFHPCCYTIDTFPQTEQRLAPHCTPILTVEDL